MPIEDLGAGISGIGQGMMNSVMYIAIFFLVMLILGGVGYWVWKNSKFNILCVIFSKRKDGDRIIIDKGGYMKNWNTKSYFFQLKKLKAKLKPPRFDYIQSQRVLFLRQLSMDTFVPIDVSDEKEIPEGCKSYVINKKNKVFIPMSYNLHEPNATLASTEADIGHWAALSMREVRDRFKIQSKLLEYMPYISFGIMMMVFMVVVIVMLKKFDAIIPAFTSASNQMASTLQSLETGGMVIPVP